MIVLELRHAVRRLLRQRAYTLTAVVTLAVGLAGAAAMVSIIERVLWRPLPYPAPHRLYSISATLPRPDGAPAPFVLSPMEFVGIRERAPAFELVGAVTPSAAAFSLGGVPITVQAGAASSEYLELFGLMPTLGRSFTQTEDRDRAAVVILDGGFWRRQLGADASLIGKTVRVDNVPRVVIGVTPEGVRPELRQYDVWIPLGAAIDPARQARNLFTAARLRPGVSAEQALHEMRAVQEANARQFPATHGRAVLVLTGLHESLYGSYRPAIGLLSAGVVILLLIACANVANLSLARLAESSADIALRLSIGASRWLILRAQLIESACLVAAGVALGLGLCWSALRVLLWVDPNALPQQSGAPLTWRVFALAAGVLTLTMLASGLAPAIRASLLPAREALADASTRTSAGGRGRRMRDVFLGLQVAFSVILLGAAVAVATGFQRLQQTDPGFHDHNVLTLQMAPPSRYPQPQERARFVTMVVETIKKLPGVVDAGTTQTNWRVAASVSTLLEIEGRPQSPDEPVWANVRHVTPGYFSTLGVRIAEGRAFNDGDAFGTPLVAVVSRSFADQIWAGQSAIGRRLKRATATAPWLTVIGVAEDVRDNGLGAPVGPTVYYAYPQQNSASAVVTLVVKTATPPLELASAIQRAISSIDPQQPITDVRTLESAVADTIAQPRFRAVVLGLFAVAGSLLAMLGVYGSAAYSGARRRREVGLRLALGGEARTVTWLLAAQIIKPIVAGAIAGIVFTAAVADAVRPFLDADEAVTVWSIVAAATLVACGLIATLVAARSAARVSPMLALRQE